MPSITVSGLGSGLDVSGIVEQLVEVERNAVEPRLDLREAVVTAEISAMGLLKSAISDFQGSFSKLSSSRTFAPVKLTSSDLDSVGATASSITQPGQYSISVNALAQSHKLASKAFSETSTAVGTGTLTFRFGTYDGNAFSVNADKASSSVTIGSADSSLQGIRDAINNAEIDVSASIVNDGSGQRLVFSSKDSGIENSMEIIVTNDGDANNTNQTGLSQLAFDPTAITDSGKNLSQTVTAQDAALTVDGLAISRSSNNVTGVITGVTLELNKLTSGTPVSLAISQDKSAVTTAINEFASSFNNMMGSFRELTKVDPDTGEAGLLVGDSLLRTMQAQIRRILAAPVPGASSEFQSLVDIGIRTQSDGSILVDSDQLQAALDKDIEAVGRLWGEGGKTSDSLVNFIGGSTQSLAGDYAVSIDTVATKGVYAGAAIGGFPITIDSSNDSFALRANDQLSSTISLTQGSYADGDALATEIASRIKGDTFLKSALISLSVSFVSDHIEISSTLFGSSSKVEITSAEAAMAATLGIGTTTGTSTTGVDVAGSIGSVSAIGDGQLLTGAGNSDGLKLEITGGTSGHRGGISYSKGVIGQLSTLFDNFLGSNGLIEDRLDALDTRKDKIATDRVDLAERITKIEDRLTSRFVTLDLALAQLNNTGDFLSAQLDAISGNNNGDN